MRFELNAFVTEKIVPTRDQQFDMCGAHKPGIVDVVSQPFPGTAQPIRSTHRRLGISVPAIEANVSTAQHLADIVNKCDPGHDPVISTYESDIQRAEQQSQASTQKFISEKVTTAVCMCDPIAPVFGTKGFTQAGYFPEILMPGLGLLDYDKLGRLYNPQQMAHAFGPSHLRDEVPFHDSDAGDQLVRWAFCKETQVIEEGLRRLADADLSR
jgi:hypothetical protein